MNNMRMRGMQVERVCCVCGVEDESIGHALFECFLLESLEKGL